jgi:hypothetical protein
MHVRLLHPTLTALSLAGISLIAFGSCQAAEPAATERLAEVRVGSDDGDIRGNDHKALQAAVDYVSGLGGGTVFIGPGRYHMRNALTLRDHVRVVGVPGETILVACAGFQTPLAADGDCNQRAISVADPSGLRVGDGVAVVDDRANGGFEVTTATITAREGANTFRLSRPLYLDYLVARKASARLVFPVVGGWQVRNAAVEGLTVEGNRGKALALDGCRGGGVGEANHGVGNEEAHVDGMFETFGNNEFEGADDAHVPGIAGAHRLGRGILAFLDHQAHQAKPNGTQDGATQVDVLSMNLDVTLDEETEE